MRAGAPGGFGFYPLFAFPDATGEPGGGAASTGKRRLWDRPRPHQALYQLQVDPVGTEVVVRTDAAGCSHEILDACTARDVSFMCGHSLTTRLASVILTVPKSRWRPTVFFGRCPEREVGEVAETTDLVDLSA